MTFFLARVHYFSPSEIDPIGLGVKASVHGFFAVGQFAVRKNVSFGLVRLGFFSFRRKIIEPVTTPPNSTSYETILVLLSLHISLRFPFHVLPYFVSPFRIFLLYPIRLPCLPSIHCVMLSSSNIHI